MSLSTLVLVFFSIVSLNSYSKGLLIRTALEEIQPSGDEENPFQGYLEVPVTATWDGPDANGDMSRLLYSAFVFVVDSPYSSGGISQTNVISPYTFDQSQYSIVAQEPLGYACTIKRFECIEAEFQFDHWTDLCKIQNGQRLQILHDIPLEYNPFTGKIKYEGETGLGPSDILEHKYEVRCEELNCKEDQIVTDIGCSNCTDGFCQILAAKKDRCTGEFVEKVIGFTAENLCSHFISTDYSPYENELKTVKKRLYRLQSKRH
jgi:hypothetical protein